MLLAPGIFRSEKNVMILTPSVYHRVGNAGARVTRRQGEGPVPILLSRHRHGRETTARGRAEPSPARSMTTRDSGDEEIRRVAAETGGDAGAGVDERAVNHSDL